MKKMVILLFVGCLLAGLTACDPLDGRTDKDTIFRLVQDNQELLAVCIENNNFDKLKQYHGIQEIHVYEDHIEFDCGGAGFGSETAYRGFFYTESNDMYAIWCAPSEDQALTAEGNGYVWNEPEGDNQYYVEKICDKFYYYDAFF